MRLLPVLLVIASTLTCSTGCKQSNPQIEAGGVLSSPLKLENEMYLLSLEKTEVPSDWEGHPDLTAYLAVILRYDAKYTEITEVGNTLQLKKLIPDNLDDNLYVTEQYIVHKGLRDGTEEVFRKSGFWTHDPFLSPESWNVVRGAEWEMLHPADILYNIPEIYQEHAGDDSAKGEAELAMNPILLDLTVKDTVVFDGDMLSGFLTAGRFGGVTGQEYKQWDISRYRTGPGYSDELFILYGNETEKQTVTGKDYYLRFIMERETQWEENEFGNRPERLGYTYSVWMGTYRNTDDRYIDSRRILLLDSEYIIPHESNVTQYSMLNLKQGKLEIRETWTMLGHDTPTPTVIHGNGRFEEFPDTPFRNDTIAASGSMYASLFGKFRPDEPWTALSFSNDQPFVKEYVTSNVSQDHLAETITLFEGPPQRSHVNLDIAFKGKFPDGHFEELEEIDPVYDDEYRKIVSCISSGIAQDLEQYRDFEYDLESLTKYTHEGKDFWFGKVVFDISEYTDWTVLIGVTPDYEMVLLSEKCLYRYRLFRMGQELYVYTYSISCGEGAYGITNLWKVDETFEHILNIFIQGD